MIDPILAHLASPDVTLERHVRRKSVALGELLSTKRSIYLDLNFWIALRKAASTGGSSKAAELLSLLKKGVAADVLFCPISESTVIELLKQTDLHTRMETAELMDELSTGAGLVGQRKRVNTEIAHTLHSTNGYDSLDPLEHLVWTKVSDVIPLPFPASTGFDPKTELAVQKAFFDHMWTISLAQIMTTIGAEEVPQMDMHDTAAVLNAGIAAHAHELRSFQKAYLDELRGAADVFGGIAVDVMNKMAREAGIVTASMSSEQRAETEGLFKNLLVQALRQGKAMSQLRSLHILACLHGALRWNKGQKLDGNDLYDFDHAVAALGYCDAFFTEGPLCNMVTQKHVGLDQLYCCRVTASLDGAIGYVASIVSGAPGESAVVLRC